jgi:hypothetical protein
VQRREKMAEEGPSHPQTPLVPGFYNGHRALLLLRLCTLLSPAVSTGINEAMRRFVSLITMAEAEEQVRLFFRSGTS